jgi:hypothetical protein
MRFKCSDAAPKRIFLVRGDGMRVLSSGWPKTRCSQTSGPSDGRMQSVFYRAVRSSNTERDPVNDRQIELGARVCACVRTA